ncbi:2568_t:CDS:2, partial [Ambispora gerdemannii]
SESKNVENGIRRDGENKLRFISDDDETYNIDINNKQIEIIVANKIIQVWAKTEKSKTLLNIWSTPSTFSRYLEDPIISIKREDSSVKNDELKIKLKSQNKNQILEHSIKIEPHAKSILGMISALKLILKQIQEFEKAEKTKNMNDDAKIKAELKNLLQNIKQAAPVIIEKAVIEKENFRILDVRFRIVATMIEADLTTAVKKILIKPNLRLHIPEKVIQYQNNQTKYNFVWLLPEPIIDKEHRSALRIACDYRYQHKLVKSLLEYYFANAKDNANWMETVTQALPELFTEYPSMYIHAQFVNELMKDIIIHQKEIPLNKSRESYLPADKYSSVRAFRCKANLYDSRQKQTQPENKKRIHSSKYRKTNTKYYQVPLPGVMQSFNLRAKDAIFDYGYNFLLKFIFLERNRGNKSPFFYLVIHDKTGEIFDNPSIEAIVDFQWRHYANLFIVMRFILYILYAILFVWQSYSHLNKIVYGKAVGALFKPVSILMCIFAYSHFVGKVRRGRYVPWSQYLLSTLYIFDLLGSTLPFIGSAWMLWVHLHYADLLLPADINGTRNTRKESLYCQLHNERCQAEVIFYSLAGLLLWVVFFFQMRFLPWIGTSIFIIINVIVNVSGFIFSQIFIIVGFAISMSLLLRFAPGLGVFPNSSTFTGNFTTINPNNQTTPNFTMTQDLDWMDQSDNYYYNWSKAIEAVYFWIGGRWDQIGNWTFWPVDLVTVLGSLVLATLMQNLLIGLMGKALGETVLVRRTLVRMRAHLIINLPDQFPMRYVYYSVPGEKNDAPYEEKTEEQLGHIEYMVKKTEEQLKDLEVIEKKTNI